MTETGASATDRFLGVWLDYQRIKADVDVERINQSGNMPDFVDTQHGAAKTNVNAWALQPWQWVLIGLAGIASVFMLVKAVK